MNKREHLQAIIDSKNPLLRVGKFLSDKKIKDSILKMDLYKGEDGLDGYTPIKGVDYFTEQEISAFVNYIQSQIKNGKDGKDGKDGERGKNGEDAIINYDKIIREVLSKIPKPKENKEIDINEIIDKVQGKIPQINYKEEVGKILSSPSFRMLMHGGGLTTVAVDGTTMSGDGTIGNPLKSIGTGTVTSVSVVSANGISGTVATATTTPAITLTIDSTYPTLTSTSTLINKRITRRVDTQATTNTITPEISTYDVFVRSAQAHDLVINNHSTSTPLDGDMMLFEILSDATPRGITYGDKYVAKAGVALPSTTVASKNLTMLFIWRNDLSQWNLLYSGRES